MSLPIDLALAECEKEAIPNWSAIAKKHGVHRTTLRRRFKGSQRSFVESRSENVQRLTLEQEEVLISFINKYSDRSMPPTSQIVKNVVEELCRGPVDKNWVGRFTKRYKHRLRAVYLRTIDGKRVSSEYIPLLEKFYTQVRLF
jgi:transposase-like protein